jgi:glycerol uptake facilitator-like aquaporin
MTPIRRIAAEALGTAFLLIAVVGSGIMGERLADGNTAIALLANSMATGGALYALIKTFGPISGAHFNPAVTLALTTAKELPRAYAIPYIVAQIAGAIAGVWLAHVMFDLPVLQSSTHVRTGMGQWTGEFIATFGLLAVIECGRQHSKDSIPASVALYILGAYWFTSSTSFANPAVTIARALTDTFAGIAPANIAGFIAAQALGAVSAVFVMRFLKGPLAGAANKSAGPGGSTPGE